jgi:hypothetical protein
MDTLGAPAHRGGLLVRHPEVSIGVVNAVSRLSGLEIEVLARRPLDRRSALRRQRDIRAAARRLLPAYDEGRDLRLGWLDPDGTAHWEYATSLWTMGSYNAEGSLGASTRAVFVLPPVFDRVSLVLAWPEIGFPETVITMPLPSRATVEEATVSFWQAPLDIAPPPQSLVYRPAHPRHHEELAIETGEIAAAPRVLHRGDQAVVVLSRVTTIGPALSLDLRSIAKDNRADDIVAHTPPPPQADPGSRPGGRIAIVHGNEASWIRGGASSFSAGDGSFSSLCEFTVERPGDNVLDLIVAWPLAQLDNAHVRIPLIR